MAVASSWHNEPTTLPQGACVLIFVTTLQHGSPYSTERAEGASLIRGMVWNVQSSELSPRQVLRKYFEHNNKIIHGVPKHQLLVWDVYKQPEWRPLCDFLGLPVPATRFPTPHPQAF